MSSPGAGDGPAVPPITPSATAPATGDPGRLALAGMIWFGAGSAVIIVTHLLRVWGESAAARFGPFVPMVAGAYAVVLGIEKMVGALRAPGGARARVAVPCAALVIAALAAGGAAWLHRAPYWAAIKSRNGGEQAAEKLRAIAERHAAALQSGATGTAALESWKRTAGEALALRPDFEAALRAARYLETTADGGLRAQAGIDAKFYALCLEWMDLYQTVRRSMGEVSMNEPPDEWDSRQNDIIDRIQALPRHPPEGS